ncbi:MAG: Rrf2 family transcriptional regulator [Psychrobacter sp.]|nr:Rrf2 family transcriptional regulator [Psychrobacter sp.]
MRLTNYSDYALRILMYLAVMPSSNTLATIADIADSYQISKSHLTKIVHQLAQLGYIDSVRGKNGGIRLAMAAKDINLGQILRHTEPDFAIVPCFGNTFLQDDVVAENADNSVDSNSSRQLLSDEKSEKVSADKEKIDLADSPSKTLCTINPSCQLKGVFYEATQAFIKVIDDYTLADITLNNKELRQLLS